MEHRAIVPEHGRAPHQLDLATVTTYPMPDGAPIRLV